MASISFWKKFWFNSSLHKILLFSIAFLLYANTLTHEYTQDDAIVIYDNMFTQKGVEGIADILKYDTFYGFFKEEGKAKLVSGGRYRPLTLVMFAVEKELFGEKPFAHHLINVLLFALLVVLLYNVFKLMLARYFPPDALGVFAFSAALLFAVHPIHTEVVANIKGRDEIMSLLLSVLTLFWMLIAVLKHNRYFLPAALGVFLLALLAKENAITFVAIIPLAFYFFTEVTVKKQIYQFAGLVAVSAIFLFIRASVLGWDFGGQSMELMNNPFLKIENGQYVHFSLLERWATILFTLGKYVELLIFPHPLTHDYYPRQIGIMAFNNWRVILSLLLYAGLGLFALIKFRKNKVVSFGILFYLITLSIVSNILFPIGTNMSERFLFMPSVGFVMIISWVLLKIREHKRWYFSVALSLIVLLMGIKTVTRNSVWKDDFTLFTTDVKTSNNSAKVLNAAGGTLVSHASNELNLQKRQKMLREAREYLKKAISIHPNYKNAYLILGNAEYYLEEYEDAINAFSNCLRLDPDYEEAKRNLAISLREAGKFFGQQKNDLKKAISYLDRAYEMLPEDYETVRLSGIAYALSGNNEKALEFFTLGVKLEPNNAGAYVNLGNVYFNMGDPERGKMYHYQALEIDPEIFSKNSNE